MSGLLHRIVPIVTAVGLVLGTQVPALAEKVAFTNDHKPGNLGFGVDVPSSVDHVCAGRKLLYQAHVDALYGTYLDGKLSTAVVDGQVVRPLSDVCLRLAPDANNSGEEVSRLVIPDDPALSDLGTPGTIVWYAPRSVDFLQQWRPIWAGMGAFDPQHEKKVPDNLVDNKVTFHLVNFDGPGDVNVFYQIPTMEKPEYSLRTGNNPISTFDYEVGGHGHYDWTFTKPGIYRLTVQITAQTTQGQELVGDPTDLIWLVGTDADVGLPEGTTTNLNKITKSAEAIRDEMGLAAPLPDTPEAPPADEEKHTTEQAKNPSEASKPAAQEAPKPEDEDQSVATPPQQPSQLPPVETAAPTNPANPEPEKPDNPEPRSQETPVSQPDDEQGHAASSPQTQPSEQPAPQAPTEPETPEEHNEAPSAPQVPSPEVPERPDTPAPQPETQLDDDGEQDSSKKDVDKPTPSSESVSNANLPNTPAQKADVAAQTQPQPDNTQPQPAEDTQPQIMDAKVTHLVTEGHMDLMALANPTDGFQVMLKDGANPARELLYPSGTFAFAVNNTTKKTLSSRARQGVPNAPEVVYELPAVQIEGIPWLGFSTLIEEGSGIDPSAPVEVSIAEFDGPGRMIATESTLLRQVVRLDSTDLSKVRAYGPRDHNHPAFWFTEPGVYKVGFRYSVSKEDGTQDSRVLTATFLVGDDSISAAQKQILAGNSSLSTPTPNPAHPTSQTAPGEQGSAQASPGIGTFQAHNAASTADSAQYPASSPNPAASAESNSSPDDAAVYVDNAPLPVSGGQPAPVLEGTTHDSDSSPSLGDNQTPEDSFITPPGSTNDSEVVSPGSKNSPADTNQPLAVDTLPAGQELGAPLPADAPTAVGSAPLPGRESPAQLHPDSAQIVAGAPSALANQNSSSGRNAVDPRAASTNSQGSQIQSPQRATSVSQREGRTTTTTSGAHSKRDTTRTEQSRAAISASKTAHPSQKAKDNTRPPQASGKPAVTPKPQDTQKTTEPTRHRHSQADQDAEDSSQKKVSKAQSSAATTASRADVQAHEADRVEDIALTSAGSQMTGALIGIGTLSALIGVGLFIMALANRRKSSRSPMPGAPESVSGTPPSHVPGSPQQNGGYSAPPWP